jgi:hypothetical protein
VAAPVLRAQDAAEGRAVVIATTLAAGGHDLRRALETQHPVARDLLGLPTAPVQYPPAPNPITDAARISSPARATMIALAVLLGAAEAATSRDSWRNPTGDTRTYFTTLVGWVYQLSEIEQLVLTAAEAPAAESGDESDLTPSADELTTEADLTLEALGDRGAVANDHESGGELDADPADPADGVTAQIPDEESRVA